MGESIERKSNRQRAIDFLETIKEGSREDDARIWFENATHEERLAAFIRLDTHDVRRR